MRKLLAIGLVILGVLISGEAFAESRTVTVTSPYYGNTTSAYSNDLRHVEQYLFGRGYYDDSINSRLNRIEQEIFNKCYSKLNTAQRMNNILANYRRNQYQSNNYLSNYYDNVPRRRGLLNRFIGYPTGFTPPIINTNPFDNIRTPGFSRGFVNNRGGYSYRNSYPTTGGIGVTILD